MSKEHRTIKVIKIIGEGSNLHDYNMKHHVIGDTNVTADKLLWKCSGRDS